LTDGSLSEIAILCESGGALRLLNPWPRASVINQTGGQRKIVEDDFIELSTRPGEQWMFFEAAAADTER
jgi:hypothetical protein